MLFVQKLLCGFNYLKQLRRAGLPSDDLLCLSGLVWDLFGFLVLLRLMWVFWTGIVRCSQTYSECEMINGRPLLLISLRNIISHHTL